MARGDLLTDAEAEFVRSLHAPDGVRLLDGFEESLRILVEEERYSTTDIGAMFGVSRERIRQLCVRFGIKPVSTTHELGMFAVRLWSDTENRFAPAKRSQFTQAQDEVRSRERTKKRADDRAQHRAEVLAAAEALLAEGGEVTMLAVARRLFGEQVHRNAASPRVRSKWFGRNYGTMQEIRDAIGLPAARNQKSA
jgi:hypothetical protein